MNTKSRKQLQQFAKAVANGDTLQKAMISAGYSESTAKRGKASLSKPMLAALAKQGAQLEYLGGLVSPEQQEKIVRGRLLLNTFHGKDEGVQSAKLLGSDKRVSMWKDDAITGVIVLRCQASLSCEQSIPVLEGEITEDCSVRVKGL
jgi:hypothetical protein